MDARRPAVDRLPGVAAGLLRSRRALLDVVYERSPENLARLVAALAPHEPYLRGAPGRPKDLEALAELIAIREARRTLE